MVALVLWPWCSSNWMATMVVPQMGNYSGGSSDWWRCCIGAVKTNMVVSLIVVAVKLERRLRSCLAEAYAKHIPEVHDEFRETTISNGRYKAHAELKGGSGFKGGDMVMVRIRHEWYFKESSEKAVVVDMHVARGTSEALNGKLMMISSGNANSIAMARPFLNAMCSKLYVFEGELGAGSRTKMVIELLEGVHFVASLEAISLGAQAGIHPWILYDIISNAAGSSWVYKNYIPQLLRGNQTKHHFLDTFIQKLESVLGLAKSLTFPLPLLSVAHQQLIAGSSYGRGGDDATMIKVWEKVLGVNITEAANLEPYNPELLAKKITAKSNSVSQIGFIGLGAMGFGMATHLLRSNFCVHGYD
ncbi:hypothetical protein RJ639_017837, partial [Escallonia herrerae]